MSGRSDLRRAAAALAMASVLASLGGCASWGEGQAGTTPAARAGEVVQVVAAENFWGSIAAQIGGSHVHVTSLIDNPDADPHDYEPTVADARAVATASYVIINGVGYDAWASKLVAANPSPHRVVLTVGSLVGVAPGGNPHRWYSPSDVRRVIRQVTSDLKELDPADAAAFDSQSAAFRTTAMAQYDELIAGIRQRYVGTKVGASESIFALLAPALGLDLITPPSFLAATSEGTEPTSADKALVDAQITGRLIKVYVYNSQNATPDVQAQVVLARAHGIPVTSITETLSPAGATFEQWQSAQLTALAKALAAASGR